MYGALVPDASYERESIKRYLRFLGFDLSVQFLSDDFFD